MNTHPSHRSSPSLMRRVIELVVRRDAKGNSIIEADKQHDIELTPDGGISTRILRHERYYDCGCSTEAVQRGGRCIVCGNVSCEVHHVTCKRCGAPVCRKHATALEYPTGNLTMLCERCGKRLVRAERVKRIGRAGFGLLVERADGGEL